MSTPLRERPDAPLGTLIFRAGLLPAETIENALEEGVKTGRRLGEILIERGLIKEEDLTRLLAGQKGLPFVNLRERTVETDAARLLAEDQARLFTALPIGHEDGVLVVAVADPTNDVLSRNIREALGQEVRFVVVARSELNDVIGEIFSGAFESPEPEFAETPAPLEVDTRVPLAHPEPTPEPERAAVAQPVPAPDVVPRAQPESQLVPEAGFDASEHDVAHEAEPTPEPAAERQPEPQAELPAPVFEAEPTPEPAVEPQPEPQPELPAPVFEAEREPEPEPTPPFEAPGDPEPIVAPLATEPVAAQSIQHSNGHVPEDFEDDSPPPAPAPAGAGYRVCIRLTSGERMIVAECDELGEAKGYAKALTKQLSSTDTDDWPFVNGRFLKPDTIVSVDVEEL